MEPDPEDPVGLPEARTGMGPEDDLKLVAKGEVLQGEVTVRAAECEEGSEGEEEQPKHPGGYRRPKAPPAQPRIRIPFCRPSPRFLTMRAPSTYSKRLHESAYIACRSGHNL